MTTVITTIDKDSLHTGSISAAIKHFSAKRLVFLCKKGDLASVLRFRNEFAKNYRIPIAVKPMGEDIAKLCRFLELSKGSLYLNAKDSHLNAMASFAAFITGTKASYGNDQSFNLLPATPSLASLLSQDQRKLLKLIARHGPVTITGLSRLNGFSENLVKKQIISESTSLMGLGLVEIENGIAGNGAGKEKISLSELGWIVQSKKS
jgi:predicted transcriptional regulator